jgi:hypothetical protein
LTLPAAVDPEGTVVLAAWIGVGAAGVAVAASVAARYRRRAGLQKRFGPEYERAVETADSRREAEKELTGREERRQELEIRPLADAARERYVERWREVEAGFADSPASAAHNAEILIQEVMRERGYPLDDLEQRAADISVDHPELAERYRDGTRLRTGEPSADELRSAMQHFRRLFDELVGAVDSHRSAS